MFCSLFACFKCLFLVPNPYWRIFNGPEATFSNFDSFEAMISDQGPQSRHDHGVGHARDSDHVTVTVTAAAGVIQVAASGFKFAAVNGQPTHRAVAVTVGLGSRARTSSLSHWHCRAVSS